MANTRNRPRVKGSWRDKNKGDCFTTKSGKVVCGGSKGMNYVKIKIRKVLMVIES